MRPHSLIAPISIFLFLAAVAVGAYYEKKAMLEHTVVQAMEVGDEKTVAYLVDSWPSPVHMRGPSLTSWRMLQTEPYAHAQLETRPFLVMPVYQGKPTPGDTVLIWAVDSGDLDLVRVCLGRGSDLDATGAWGETALHRAAALGFTKAAELLVERGANANARTVYSQTHVVNNADGGGPPPGLEIGNLVPPRDSTPLHLAISESPKSGIAEMLIARGADVRAVDQSKKTPLHLAARRDDPRIARLLLDRGADVEARDAGGSTPLSHARTLGVAQALVAAGADVNAPGWRGQTPIIHIALEGADDMVAFLLAQGADPLARNPDNLTALHFAADREVAEMFVAQGADVNAVDAEGKTPLHYMAMWGRFEAAKYIVGRGASARAADNGGRTPLHYLANSPNKAFAELLIENGADVNAKDKSGATPLKEFMSRRPTKAKLDDEADTEALRSFIDLLRRHGATE